MTHGHHRNYTTLTDVTGNVPTIKKTVANARNQMIQFGITNRTHPLTAANHAQSPSG